MCATQPIARTVRAAADKEENRGKPRFCFYMPVHEAPAGLFGTGCPVHTRRVCAALGPGSTFLGTGGAGHTNCVSVFAPNGRGSFAEIQRGIALCGARESAAPAAGAKRKDNLRFSFLFELLPFPGIVWRRLPTCDRCEIGERQSGYSCVCFAKYSQFTDSVLLHIRFTLRRRDIPVSRNSLARYDRQHLRG